MDSKLVDGIYQNEKIAKTCVVIGGRGSPKLAINMGGKARKKKTGKEKAGEEKTVIWANVSLWAPQDILVKCGLKLDYFEKRNAEMKSELKTELKN